jgi:hypothetical protein
MSSGYGGLTDRFAGDLARTLRDVRRVSPEAFAPNDCIPTIPDSPPLPRPARWFELQEDLLLLSFADAYLLVWDGSANSGDGAYTPDDSETFRVFDSTGQVSAPAGTWVKCQPLNSNNGIVWEPVFLPPLKYRGALAGQLNSGSSATMTIAGGTITVYDDLLAAGDHIDTGKKIHADWFPRDGKFYVTASEGTIATPVEVSVLTGVLVNETAGELQQVTRTIRVAGAEDEDEASKVYDVTTCPA